MVPYLGYLVVRGGGGGDGMRVQGQNPKPHTVVLPNGASVAGVCSHFARSHVLWLKGL